MKEKNEDDRIKAKLRYKIRKLRSKIAKLRKELLAQWRGTPLCYSNMPTECRVAFLMGRLKELEK